MIFPKFIPFLLYGSRVINLWYIMLFTHLLIPPKFLIQKINAPSKKDRANISWYHLSSLFYLGHSMHITRAHVLAYSCSAKRLPDYKSYTVITACTTRCLSKMTTVKFLPFIACNYFVILIILSIKSSICQAKVIKILPTR